MSAECRRNARRVGSMGRKCDEKKMLVCDMRKHAGWILTQLSFDESPEGILES